jgi:hypothetical protein
MKKSLNIKLIFIKLVWLLSQFGIEPLRFLRGLRGTPAYLRDLFFFRGYYRGPLNLMPCLHDRYSEGGVTKSEYFWQDLLVARWIYEANPRKHLDVGSRIDGFVAHVASFRELEVMDVRPITSVIPGVEFRLANLMSPESIADLSMGGGYCDSISCLHVLEHLGLGRYGDQLDALGYEKGIAHLAMLLQPKGTLYLSTPVGRERVEFNANWVFEPQKILSLAATHCLQLTRIVAFNRVSGLVEIDVVSHTSELGGLAQTDYSLLIMQFIKEAI